MKLSLDLESIGAGYDYEETLGKVLRDEIERELRSAVKDSLKEHRKAISAKVKQVTDEALKQLSAKKLQDMAKGMIANL